MAWSEATVDGSGAAAQHARLMATELTPLLGCDVVLDLSTAPSSRADWVSSGAADLTGYPDGPPLDARGHPASAARAALAWFVALTGASGLPGVEVLGERAATHGLRRNAPSSCGGAMRFVPARDGLVAISLARETDLGLIPALLEGPAGPDAWLAVRRWARGRSAQGVADRCQLLGIPAAPVGDRPPMPTRPWLVSSAGGPRRVSESVPLVVDLTALWAGPLCARLLRLSGAHVVKVESTARPDGARQGSPAFFELMHAGSEQVALDFRTRAGRDGLRELVERADVVLESSRPRALRQLGVVAEEVVGRGTTWLSITARGRGSDWVGFGDDIAAGAGLLAATDEPLPAADALADPLSGLHGAAAVAAAMTSDRAWLLDLSMHDVALLCLGRRFPDPAGSTV